MGHRSRRATQMPLGGVLYWQASFFALRFGASYTYMFVARTSAHALTETVDVRFMF